MSNLGVTLFWCCVQITLVTTTGAIACLLLRGCQPRVRGRLLQITFVVTLALSALAFSPWPRWDTGTAARGRAAHVVESHVQMDAVDEQAIVTGAPAATAPAAAGESVSPVQHWIDSVWGALQDLNNLSALRLLTLIVLSGLLIGCCRCLAGVTAVRRIVRSASPVRDEALLALLEQLRVELACQRFVDVRETDQLSTAATIGWRTPLILLPADWRRWSGEERRAVLAHELAHIVRQDFAGLVVAQISSVLHFYHPLMHWLVARLRLEQELVADAMAACVAGGRAGYLAVLATMALRVEDQPMGWPARSFLPTRGTFLRRIEMLRDSREATGRMRAGLATGALAAVVVIGVLASGLRSQDAKPRDEQAEEAATPLEKSRNNLKTLGLAMRGYHEEHGHFPPAVVAGENGQTHSWRVALLPFLGLQDLYDQYQLDEPWDSEANMNVLEQIPDVYRAPQDDAESSNASYFVFAGEGTPFSGDEGVRIRDFRDGTSNTILIVEFKKATPWTKPEDIAYPPDPDNPPEIAGWYDDRLMATLADGSARGFPIQMNEEVSHALIEISDGNRIDWSEIPNLTR
jgi:beta-lactamase regulating signal transducer with metallopeptidase domain